MLTRFYGGTRQDWQVAPWGEAIQFYRAIPRVLLMETGIGTGQMEGVGLVETVEKLSRPVTKTPSKRKPLSDMGIRLFK